MKTSLLISFLAAIIASHCGSQNHTNVTDSSAIKTDTTLAASPAISNTLAGRWNLIPAMASDTAAGRLPYLVFDTGRVSGNTGCNSFSGRYKQADNNLSFDANLITTKMACAGYDESAFIKNLLRITGFTLQGDTLVLKADVTPVSYWLKSSDK